MLTISKPLSAGQARSYHSEEFANAKDNYYTQGREIVGEWHGRLAEEWGLKGEVQAEQFHRLSEGQHPISGEQLVRHQSPREYLNEQGEKIKTMEHRAGWDATFSAPKSVSLTALVGHDERVREAHRESVSVALAEMERFVQARIGSNLPAETTGKWAAARFEHDSSRPVDGYAAPQLHTHVVFFNVTQTANGDSRALQPRELYKSQQYATAIYRSELAARLKQLGYEVERGKSGQPEIKGYSAEYLEASSPRRRQIEEHLARTNQRGAGAAQIAAHQTREKKHEASHEEMQEKHKDLAKRFGNQPEHVVEAARRQGNQLRPEPTERVLRQAVAYSTEKNFEREAVTDERTLLRDALNRSMGHATLGEIKSTFEQEAHTGELREVNGNLGLPSRSFTTTEMQSYERDTIQKMKEGQGRSNSISARTSAEVIQKSYPQLNETQRKAVSQILSGRDQVMALEGVAGSGKTTSLAAIREVAQRNGYKVEGFAPTSRAAQQLSESGIESGTLQRHLSSPREDEASGKKLYVLDESSLASTKQMNEFLNRLGDEDRVLLVGDTRQHQAVEAGRPYQQLREAGVETARLEEIVRQKEPKLREVVEQLSRGEVKDAIDNLYSQNRLHEIGDRAERVAKIADEYSKKPEGTLVVSPDNQSRIEINNAIHRKMQETGRVGTQEQNYKVLVPRQEVTSADRRWAGQYEPGNVLRYAKGSKELGITPGEYARIEAVEEKKNQLTVARHNGERVTYDPRRLQGVTVYREIERSFSKGERVQFTAPNKELGVANRELATIERIDSRGNMRLKLESGRAVEFNAAKNPHIDYGYAVTSHSSQGQTADRVLVHIDTNQAGEKLVNRRLAYVAVSRGRYDAQIYTNDGLELRESLSREISKTVALDVEGLLERGRNQQIVTQQNGNTASQTKATYSQGATREVQQGNAAAR
jgi:conjugative relaxase-like TrwC/TraI family protein